MNTLTFIKNESHVFKKQTQDSVLPQLQLRMKLTSCTRLAGQKLVLSPDIIDLCRKNICINDPGIFVKIGLPKASSLKTNRILT